MGIVTDQLGAARRRIRTGYGLVVVGNALDLLWPFAVGVAINGLVDGSWVGVGLFVGLSLAHTLVGFVGQRHTSRTFNRLHATIAADLVARQRAAGVDTASVSGRTELAGEYVGFLESDVPLAITAAFTIIGSLGMLFVYDPVVGLAAAIVGLPVAVVNRRLMTRSEGVFEELNELTEAEVDVIGRGRGPESSRHFGMVSRRWIRLSDAEAASWSLSEVIAVGLWVVALVRAASGGLELGGIIALIAYVWFYTAGFDEVPGVLQRLTRLRDIRRRLGEEDDPVADPPAAH